MSRILEGRKRWDLKGLDSSFYFKCEVELRETKWKVSVLREQLTPLYHATTNCAEDFYQQFSKEASSGYIFL